MQHWYLTQIKEIKKSSYKDKLSLQHQIQIKGQWKMRLKSKLTHTNLKENKICNSDRCQEYRARDVVVGGDNHDEDDRGLPLLDITISIMAD